METIMGVIILVILIPAMISIIAIPIRGIGLLGSIIKYRVEREKTMLKKNVTEGANADGNERK